jgi:hypothetical protein
MLQLLQDVQMKGIQNKKFISQKLIFIHDPDYVIWKENSESFFHAQLTRMRQLVTFGKLSNDVYTTGTDSICCG